MQDRKPAPERDKPRAHTGARASQPAKKKKPLSPEERAARDAQAAEMKERLRPLCRARRDGITGDVRRAAQAAMLEQLFSLPLLRDASVICGYASTPGEIDLLPVWRRAVALGKTYALPCTISGKAEGRMLFRTVSGYDPASLVKGRFGIPEPDESRPPLTASQMHGAVMLVPGLAFDAKGHRIGYGGGYYDRYLANCRAEGIPVLTVGLVFDDCFVDRLPHTRLDVPVNIVLTERRLTVTHGF